MYVLHEHMCVVCAGSPRSNMRLQGKGVLLQVCSTYKQMPGSLRAQRQTKHPDVSSRSLTYSDTWTAALTCQAHTKQKCTRHVQTTPHATPQLQLHTPSNIRAGTSGAAASVCVSCCCYAVYVNNYNARALCHRLCRRLTTCTPVIHKGPQL